MTGGTGFIGSHLVDVLLERKWSVRCLVRENHGLSWLGNLPVERCPGDCRSPASLGQAVRGVDVVFHLAGATKALDERTYFEVNGVGTGNLLRACVEINPGVKAFVYVSSQAAAGPSSGKARTEADRCAPVSVYGRSKRLGEEIVLGQSARIPVTIVRPPVVYGPRDRALLRLFKLLSRGIRPCLAGRGEQEFSFCYVDDLVRGLLLVCEKEEARGQIFFLSDGGAYRWKDIGDAFARTMGRGVREITIPEFSVRACALVADMVATARHRPGVFSRDKVREMVQPGWVCDIGKSRRLLGFEPRVTLDEGAALTFEWYKGAKWL